MKTLSCDVLVVGGGCAGIGACCGAASRGARVVIVERNGCFGGLATAAGVGTICGLYLRDPSGPRPVGRGFAQDWASLLMRESDKGPVAVGPGLHVLPYDVSPFKALANTMLRGLPLIEPVLAATLVSAQVQTDSTVLTRASVNGEDLTIRAAAAVDASGDALLVRMAGGATEDISASQAPAVILTLERPVPELAELAARLALLRTIHHAAGQGRLPSDCATATFVPADFGRDVARLKITLSSTAGPGASDLAHRESVGREAVEAVSALLRTMAPYRNACPAAGPVQVGVRASFRAIGQITLSQKDVTTGRKREDGVARGAWPIERWTAGAAEPELELLAVGDFYDVPLGCLRVQGWENVFVAGRCLSADAGAMASVRVMATSLDTGYAAGVAAAQLVKTGDAQSAIELVRTNIQGSGS